MNWYYFIKKALRLTMDIVMFNMNKLIKITYIGGIIMSILTSILGTLVAIEFFYIFYLETVATVSANTARVFKMEEEE